jgi:hypothetical protein
MSAVKPVPIHDRLELFGDGIMAAELAGLPVRLRVELRDADLYAFRFSKELILSWRTI